MAFDLNQLKGILNVAKEKGTEFAGVAAEKAKLTAKLAKLSAEYSGEKESLKKAYAELGKAYYEKYQGSAEGLFAQLCDEVTAVGKRAAALKEEIDGLKASLRDEGIAFEEVVAEAEPDITVEVTEEPKE